MVKDIVSMEFKMLLYVIVSKIMIAILSFIGNVLEITAFLKTKTLRTSTNYFITSMAFSEVIYVISVWVLYSMSRLSFFEDILTSVVCKLCSYSLNLSFLASMPRFLLISAERFAAIVYPLKLSTITGATRTIFLMLSWLFPMVLLSPVLYFASWENTAERRGLFLLKERSVPCLLCTRWLRVYLFISYLWL